MRYFNILILVTTFQSVMAMWPESWIIGEACHNCAQYSKYENCEPQDLKCLCSSKNYLSTVAKCIMDRANKSATQRDRAWDHFSFSVCEIHDAGVSDRDFQDAQKYLMGTRPIKASTKDSSLWQPVKITDEQFDNMYHAVYINLKQKDVSVWEGSFLVGFWVFIMLISSFGNLMRYMSIRFSHRRASMAKPAYFTRLINRKIMIPACFGFKHMCRLRIFGLYFMIPTRFETIVVGVYFILNIIFMVAPYEFVQGENPLYETHYKEMMRYVSDRSGIIATIQIPLFTLYALRNNVCQWLTGWNYTVFNTYHRAIARVAYLQLIVHAITKHVFAGSYGASLVKYFYPLPYYRWGVAAMFLMALMIMSGQFRVNHYELFLRFHILAAIGAYICSFKHLDGLGYKQPIYLAFGFWAADWILRFSRILFLNFSIFLEPATINSKRSSFAKVCLLGDDLVWLKVRTPVHWHFKPGQYCFIHVNRLRFWEGHPFSIINPGPDNEDESFQMMCKQRGGMTKRFVKRLKERGATSDNPMDIYVVVEGPYGIHCPVERYDNIMLIAGGVGVTGVLPYVEYCTSNRVISRGNPHVVFVWAVQSSQEAEWVGRQLDRLSSAGRCEMLIYCMRNEHASIRIEDEKKNEEESTRFTTIDLNDNEDVDDDDEENMVVRQEHFKNPAFLNAIDSEMELQDTDTLQVPSEPPSRTNTPIKQNLQRRQVGGGSEFGDSEDTTIDFRNSKSDLIKVVTTQRLSTWRSKIKTGRPDLNHTIEQFFKRADGSSCVLGCGPPPMMDAIRQSVVEHYELNEHGRVDYFEEAYSW